MRNINFSADMVGIQTLAQQGIAAPRQDSALSFGGASFDDLILQMISNNLTLDENAVSDDDLAVQLSDKLIMQLPDDADKKDSVSDNLLYNILTPELIAQLAAIYNVQPAGYTDFVQRIVDTASAASDIAVSAADMTMYAESAISDVVNKDVQQTDGMAQDVYNFRAEYNNTVSENNVQTQGAQNQTQDMHNYKAAEDMHGEMGIDTVKAEPAKLNTVQNAVSEQGIRDAVKTEFTAAVSDEKDTRDSNDTMFADTQKMSFVSTADMLRMRNVGKAESADGTMMFKVSDTAVNIDSTDAAEKLAEKIITRINENEFEVELYPKNLGKISVSLVLENGIVRVAMSGTNAKVNEFLASQSANVQSIVEKNTQYHAVVRVDDSQNQYNQQQRDNTQQSADDSQRQRQQEHMQNLYQQNSVQHTEDFLSMLRLV